MTHFANLNGDTRYEIWKDKCADYSMLKTFGCAILSHQNEENVELRVKKCVFLDYPKGVKEHNLWDRIQKGVKIIVSCNITFNEYKIPCKKGEEKQQTFRE